jgi:hypothetical protein
LSRRHQAQSLPAQARAHSQHEVVAGLSAQEALAECRRCLRCDLRVESVTNRKESAVAEQSHLGTH